MGLAFGLIASPVISGQGCNILTKLTVPILPDFIGRDNRVAGNLFIDTACVHYDALGQQHGDAELH